MDMKNLSVDEIRAVLSRLDCYFFVKDQNARYTYVNDAVSRLFDKSSKDIIGGDDSQFFDLDQCHDLIQHDRKVLEGESLSKVEQSTDIYGVTHHYQVLKTPFYDSEGNVAGIFGLAIDISESIAKRDEYEYLSIRDVLTGVYNRRYLELQLKREIASHACHNKPLSYIMLDVDNFKRINDSFGHSIGDHVLKTVATLMESSVREEDYCFRFGGDEFAMLLPLTSLLSAYKVAERLRASVAEHEFVSSEGQLFTINVSLGVSQLSDGNSGLLVAQSDGALMTVKRERKGKNMTLVYCDKQGHITQCEQCHSKGNCQ
jgi:diguanylate cyclase (GGDEF)-like protein/PAS domain S-box-containing protein